LDTYVIPERKNIRNLNRSRALGGRDTFREIVVIDVPRSTSSSPGMGTTKKKRFCGPHLTGSRRKRVNGQVLFSSSLS
jgi:hypothetical protein